MRLTTVTGVRVPSRRVARLMLLLGTLLLVLHAFGNDVSALTLTGYGDEVSSGFPLSAGLATFRMQHDGTGYFGVVLRDDLGGWVDLLVSEIGSFDGGRAVGIDSPGIHLLD